MKKLLGNLIIVSPASANIIKFRYTPAALATVVFGFLISFGVVVALGCNVPSVASEPDKKSLEMENQQLKSTNRDQQLKVETIDNRLLNLEAQSQRIKDLIDTE